MFAVIQAGGRQHRVEVGDVVRVDRLPTKLGESVVFDRVLLVGRGESTDIGNPAVTGARVRATVVGHERARKVLIYTYKRRKNSNRGRQGHRQAFTEVKIDAIEA